MKRDGLICCVAIKQDRTLFRPSKCYAFWMPLSCAFFLLHGREKRSEEMGLGESGAPINPSCTPYSPGRNALPRPTKTSGMELW